MSDEETMDCSNDNDRRLSWRCSPTRVCSLVTNLDGDRKQLVREMGFGSILGLKKCSLRTDLLLWLLDRFNPVDGSLNINGKMYMLGSSVFSKIMGIMDGGEHIPELKLKQKGNNTCGRLSLRILEQRLEKNKDPHFFIRDFVTYVVGMLLMPSTSVYIVRSLEESFKELNDVRAVKNKNWASASWRFLVDSVGRFKEKRTRFLPGCLYFLQIYFFAQVNGCNRYVDREICPTNWWSDRESKPVMTWIHSNGGLDNVEFRANVDMNESQATRMSVRNCLGNASRKDNNVHDSEDLKEVVKYRRKNYNTVDSENITDRRPLKKHNGIMNDTYVFEDFVGSGYLCVGPYVMQEKMDISHYSIAQYLYERSLPPTDILFQKDDFKVQRYYFRGLEPNGRVDVQMVASYCFCLKLQELLKIRCGEVGCLVLMPVKVKNGITEYFEVNENGDYPLVNQFIRKLLVPILDMDSDHWFMGEIVFESRTCNLWDSLWSARSKQRRFTVVKDTLRVIEEHPTLSCMMLSGANRKISNFPINVVKDVVQQSNGVDCGVFTMIFMRTALSAQTCVTKFCVDTARIQLGFEIALSIFNDVLHNVVVGAQQYFFKKTSLLGNDTVFNECGNSDNTRYEMLNPKLLGKVPTLATNKQRKRQSSRLGQKKRRGSDVY